MQEKYVEAGGSLDCLRDGRYGHGVKVNSAMREWLYERKRQDASLTTPQLVEALRQEYRVILSDRHINYLLRKVGLTSAPGRPYKACTRAEPEKAGPLEESESGDKGNVTVEATDNAGLFPTSTCPLNSFWAS